MWQTNPVKQVSSCTCPVIQMPAWVLDPHFQQPATGSAMYSTMRIALQPKWASHAACVSVHKGPATSCKPIVQVSCTAAPCRQIDLAAAVEPRSDKR